MKYFFFPLTIGVAKTSAMDFFFVFDWSNGGIDFAYFLIKKKDNELNFGALFFCHAFNVIFL